MFVGTLKRGTILIVFKNTFKNRLQNIFKYVVTVVATFSTTVLYANTYNGVKYDAKQIQCLSINAYMEARGQGVKGMQAVTWVVLNRTNHPSYPSTPCAVIKQPQQFSWWNGKTPQIKEKDAYTQAERVVEGVLSGKLKDNTNSSTHFHLARIKPKWSSRLSYTTTIGSHCFYKMKK